MKLSFLKNFTKEQVRSLEYKNEEEYNKLKP